MSATVALVDGYLEASVVLTAMFPLWWLLARALRVCPGASHRSRRRALRAALAAAVLGPALAAAAALLWPGWAASAIGGVASPARALSALYLQGYLAVDPALLDRIIGIRDLIRAEVATPASAAVGLLGLALAAGFALLLLRCLAQILALRGLLRRSYPWRRAGRLVVLVSDEVAVPFAAASPWRSTIVLPSRLLLDSADLRIAIAHEGQHLRNGDLRWVMLLEAARLLFFWNPVVRLWAREQSRTAELACDEAVLARGRVSARDYGACLIRACREATRPLPVVSAMAGALPRDARFLETRIVSLASAAPRRRRSAPALVPLALALAAFLSLVAHDAGGWSSEELQLATVANLKSELVADRMPAYGLVMAYR